MLKQNYSCDYVGGRCKLSKCDRYKSCAKVEKKNFEAWNKAYKENMREELDKLTKGGL